MTDLTQNSKALAQMAHFGFGLGLPLELAKWHVPYPFLLVLVFFTAKEVLESLGWAFWEPKQTWGSSAIDWLFWLAGLVVAWV